MTLTFPFRNKVYHDLIGFYDSSRIKDYILTQEGKYPYPKNYFEDDIKFYRSSLVNFENELLQVINTTIQETIDIYFKELLDYAIDIDKTFNIDNLKQIIYTINNNELVKYNEKIESKSLDY